MTTPKGLQNAVIAGDVATLKRLVQESIEQGVKAGDTMNDMIAAMDIIGEKMGSGQMFIPEVLMAAKAMSEGTELLKPFLAEDDSNSKGVIVLGSVRGDLHDIGKNLVEILLTGAGFTVVDLGVDVPLKKFVAAVREHNPIIVAMSALLTTTMPAMKEVIDALGSAGLRDQAKILVGGAPVTEAYAEKIGADAYGADAGEAARIARSFL